MKRGSMPSAVASIRSGAVVRTTGGGEECERAENRNRRVCSASAAFAASLLLTAASARGQGPQFDVGSPPGAAGGASAVGQPLGAANFPDFGSPSNAPFCGRAGPMGGHMPASALTTPGVPVFIGVGAQQTIRQTAPPLEIPQVGEPRARHGHHELRRAQAA